jgi:hypothetical protein
VISVVIPALDASQALKRSLLSISRQTTPPDEIVVVANGARSRGVAEAVQSWSELTPKPRVLEIGEPAGVGRALNAGIRATEAEFVARMDAGDWSYPERLEAEVSVLKNHKLDLVASEFVAVTPQGAKLPNLRGSSPAGEALKWHLLVQNCLAHPTVMLRRRSLLDVGLYDETVLFEDYDLWLRVANDWRMGLVERPLLEYSYARGSQTRKYKRRGASQLVEQYSHTWRVVAGIELASHAAERLLAPELRPHGEIASQASFDAMLSLNELEDRAASHIDPKEFGRLRQRVSISRAELVASTALTAPAQAMKSAMLVPKSARGHFLNACFTLARFSAKRSSFELAHAILTKMRRSSVEDPAYE